MPNITRSLKSDYDTTTALRACLLADIPCSVDIPGAGVPLTLVAAGWKPAATGDTVYGFSSRKATANGPYSDPVTCYGNGVRFHYADSGLTVGAPLYLTATAGVLATEVNGTAVAYALSATDIITTGGLL